MQLWKSFRILLMMISLAWVFVNDAGQLSLPKAQQKLQEANSFMSLESIQKVSELNKNIRGIASVTCQNACIKIKSKVLNQEFLLDSGDDAIRFDLLDNDVLEFELVNSKQFDSVMTYGSDQADFSDQDLFINWTRRDMSSLQFKTTDLKHRFYKTEWRSLESKKIETAVFAVDAIVVKPPEFIFHHQRVGSGLQQLLLSQTFKKGESGLIESTEPLLLSRTSLIGYEFKNDEKNMKSCKYFAPNGSIEDCIGWFRSRVIRSISDQDVGVHRIELLTEHSQILYQFRILGLQ